MKKFRQIAIIVLIVGALALAYVYRERIAFGVTELVPEETVTIPGTISSDNNIEPKTLHADLEIPWEMAYLPDGSILVTERPGRLVHISYDGRKIEEVEGVEHVGEGGLLGMALHPNFEENRYLYLYMTTVVPGGLTNRIVRYRYSDGALSERTTILQNIPGARYHDGGRMAFGPDNKLYVTTGDAGEPFAAQDIRNLAGKILRIEADGSVPKDNPFNNHVWSYGHRNPQGIAWDNRGRMWSTEHGPSGLESGHDEINLIEKGGNYGWPIVKGDQEHEGMIPPIMHSGANETWAPASLTAYGDDLIFTGLRGKTLYQFLYNDVTDDKELIAHFKDEFGRLRTVHPGKDSDLLLLTSNRDGRGPSEPEDDRIISVSRNTLTITTELRKRFR